MSRHVLIAFFFVVLAIAAGPTLIALFHAAVPLVIAGGVFVLLGRLVWYFTNRW